jgi:hypothetical protein
MKKLILLLAFISLNTQAHTIAMCNGEYALCAASSTYANGNVITVNGKQFKEGVAVCPVLTGTAVANLDLMGGSCKAPKGQVWSLFGVPAPTTFPQAPDWNQVTPVVRSFTTSVGKGLGMSNMWSFLCTKRPKQVNGVTLADCVGPINESPFDNSYVKPGANVFTMAPVGAVDPVGGNFPNK